MVHRETQYGLKVDIAFSRAKTIVGCLQRATWNKKYRVWVKSVALLQNCKLKSKKIVILKYKKMFLFAKIDKNFQFKSLFLGNFWNFYLCPRKAFLSEDWKCYPPEAVSSLQFFTLEIRERKAYRKQTGSNVSVLFNKVSALEQDLFKQDSLYTLS